MQEKIIQTKICKHCQNPFDITDRDLAFYDKVSPTFAGKKYQIPAPTFCPDCRQQRRMSFRNERKLYKRKCDLTGKDIISIYSLDKPYQVYEHHARWSDQWSALDYGQEMEFSKSFFQQRKTLYDNVPRITLNGHSSNENSPYVNYTLWIKNGYYSFGGGYNENICYTTLLMRCNDCMDSHFSLDCDQCYEVTYCDKCYNLHFSNHCEGCRDSYVLEDCNGCTNCFACSHLNNVSYHVFNKEVSKEVYEQTVKKFLANDPEIKNQIQDFFAKTPYNQRYLTRAHECSGHNIKDAKNCTNVFTSQESEDLKYCNVTLVGIKDSYDIDHVGVNASLQYEIMNASLNVYHNIFSFVVRENSQYLMYCCDISNCQNCFGCVGLRDVSYCILNKQYTREDYEKLVPQIIEKMKADEERGEFFPSSLSPFGYNETIAYEDSPLTKEEAIKQGFNRSDYEAPVPHIEKTLKADELPTIENVTDEILQQAIICEASEKPFRIIKPELEFYRRHRLPLPHKHPDIRHMERMKKTNLKKLFDRTCAKCGIDIKTTYSPDRPETVYCETCYNKEIYG